MSALWLYLLLALAVVVALIRLLRLVWIGHAWPGGAVRLLDWYHDLPLGRQVVVGCTVGAVVVLVWLVLMPLVAGLAAG